MRLLQQSLSTGIQTRLFTYTYPIIIGLMNITIVSPPSYLLLHQDTKFFLIIRILSNLFHVNLILHPLASCWKEKIVLIYWMMNILQSIMSLLKPKINQPVIKFWHRLRKCVYLIYQCTRTNIIPRITWWPPLQSDSMWKIKCQYQVMPK